MTHPDIEKLDSSEDMAILRTSQEAQTFLKKVRESGCTYEMLAFALMGANKQAQSLSLQLDVVNSMLDRAVNLLEKDFGLEGKPH